MSPRRTAILLKWIGTPWTSLPVSARLVQRSPLSLTSPAGQTRTRCANGSCLSILLFSFDTCRCCFSWTLPFNLDSARNFNCNAYSFYLSIVFYLLYYLIVYRLCLYFHLSLLLEYYLFLSLIDLLYIFVLFVFELWSLTYLWGFCITIQHFLLWCSI